MYKLKTLQINFLNTYAYIFKSILYKQASVITVYDNYVHVNFGQL